MKYYTKRTIEYGVPLNLVTDLMYDRALKLAEQRDSVLKNLIPAWSKLTVEEISHKMRELGQLFGVPMSTKECFEFENMDSTLGASYHCFKPEKEDGLVVNLLINAGAVPFVKSNVPQLLLINETNNYIFGQAKNPWDPRRTPGGSSGGEAGLICLGCSPIGIGSDGGGSIRIPALYCGIFGFRPTGQRFTFIGHKPPSDYIPRNVKGAVGPLAKSIEDCERMAHALQDQQLLIPSDCLLSPQPWKYDQTFMQPTKKLRIGFIRRLKVTNLNPPVFLTFSYSSQFSPRKELLMR